MERALIVALLIVLVGIIILFALIIHRLRLDFNDLEKHYDLLIESHEYDLDKLVDINAKYAKSLDERERLLNDMNLMRKKLEIEIDKRDSEIAKMDAILSYSKKDDISNDPCSDCRYSPLSSDVTPCIGCDSSNNFEMFERQRWEGDTV